MTNQNTQNCPHCGQKMSRWECPPETGYEGLIKFVCFNNECTYYVRGWEHTKKTMNKPASYRHSLNPQTGKASPLPVWDENALREFILPDEEN
jgi:hypothetical protein